MSARRFIAGVLIATFCSGALPATAGASEPANAARNTVARASQAAAHTSLRASIDRAAVDLAVQQQLAAKTRPATRNATTQAPSGGGGSGMMIVSLISIAAGIGVTYYMVKQMKKVTTPQ